MMTDGMKSCWTSLLHMGVLVLAVLIPSQGYGQTKSLTIGYPAEKNDFHDAAAEVIRVAYERLGVTVNYKAYPAERSLFMANEGQSDGELVRIAGLTAKYPNLIQIPFSHAAVEQMAFSVNEDLKISGWNSLAPFKITFDRGFKVAERNTMGMNVHPVSSHEAAFLMVKNGRMDVAIANRFTGARILQNPEFKAVIMIEPPLQVSPLYHYLNVRHKHLIQPVMRVLEEMNRSGEIDAIKTRYNVNAGR